uniref:Uncharacterized protein n=1 Tax=Timema poppense TaxID=170557 RepID=A0A7R9CJV3_TIMPO|nr:unnamed protein product [Timema poppensis]
MAGREKKIYNKQMPNKNDSVDVKLAKTVPVFSDKKRSVGRPVGFRKKYSLKKNLKSEFKVKTNNDLNFAKKKVALAKTNLLDLSQSTTSIKSPVKKKLLGRPKSSAKQEIHHSNKSKKDALINITVLPNQTQGVSPKKTGVKYKTMGNEKSKKTISLPVASLTSLKDEEQGSEEVKFVNELFSSSISCRTKSLKKPKLRKKLSRVVSSHSEIHNGIRNRNTPYLTRSDSSIRVLRNGKRSKLKDPSMLDGLDPAGLRKKRKRFISLNKDGGTESDSSSVVSLQVDIGKSTTGSRATASSKPKHEDDDTLDEPDFKSDHEITNSEKSLSKDDSISETLYNAEDEEPLSEMLLSEGNNDGSILKQRGNSNNSNLGKSISNKIAELIKKGKVSDTMVDYAEETNLSQLENSMDRTSPLIVARKRIMDNNSNLCESDETTNPLLCDTMKSKSETSMVNDKPKLSNAKDNNNIPQLLERKNLKSCKLRSVPSISRSNVPIGKEGDISMEIYDTMTLPSCSSENRNISTVNDSIERPVNFSVVRASISRKIQNSTELIEEQRSFDSSIEIHKENSENLKTMKRTEDINKVSKSSLTETMDDLIVDRKFETATNVENLTLDTRLVQNSNPNLTDSLKKQVLHECVQDINVTEPISSSFLNKSHAQLEHCHNSYSHDKNMTFDCFNQTPLENSTLSDCTAAKEDSISLATNKVSLVYDDYDSDSDSDTDTESEIVDQITLKESYDIKKGLKSEEIEHLLNDSFSSNSTDICYESEEKFNTLIADDYIVENKDLKTEEAIPLLKNTENTPNNELGPQECEINKNVELVKNATDMKIMEATNTTNETQINSIAIVEKDGMNHDSIEIVEKEGMEQNSITIVEKDCMRHDSISIIDKEGMEHDSITIVERNCKSHDSISFVVKESMKHDSNDIVEKGLKPDSISIVEKECMEHGSMAIVAKEGITDGLMALVEKDCMENDSISIVEKESMEHESLDIVGKEYIEHGLMAITEKNSMQHSLMTIVEKEGMEHGSMAIVEKEGMNHGLMTIVDKEDSKQDLDVIVDKVGLEHESIDIVEKENMGQDLFTIVEKKDVLITDIVENVNKQIDIPPQNKIVNLIKDKAIIGTNTIQECLEQASQAFGKDTLGDAIVNVKNKNIYNEKYNKPTSESTSDMNECIEHEPNSPEKLISYEKGENQTTLEGTSSSESVFSSSEENGLTKETKYSIEPHEKMINDNLTKQQKINNEFSTSKFVNGGAESQKPLDCVSWQCNTLKTEEMEFSDCDLGKLENSQDTASVDSSEEKSFVSEMISSQISARDTTKAFIGQEEYDAMNCTSDSNNSCDIKDSVNFLQISNCFSFKEKEEETNVVSLINDSKGTDDNVLMQSNMAKDLNEESSPAMHNNDAIDQSKPEKQAIATHYSNKEVEEKKESNEPTDDPLVQKQASVNRESSDPPKSSEEYESPEDQAIKEKILSALGLQSLRAVKANATKPSSKKENVSYTGTLKTIIKVQRASDKRTRTRMVQKQGRSRTGENSSGTGDDGDDNDGEELEDKFEYRIQSTSADPHKLEFDFGNRKSLKTGFSYRSYFDISSNPQLLSEKDVADTAVKDVTGKDDSKSASGKQSANLVIPEKSSSFSIHPGRLCSDVCSYCFGKFGSLDTPCHIAQLKGIERQQKILGAETHLTADSCLCDACYRHVDRKANCPSYKPNRKRQHRPGVAQFKSSCCVQDCTQPAHHTIRRKWLIKLRRSIANKVPIDTDKIPQHLPIPLCSQHYYWVDYYMVCGVCKRRLTRSHMYPTGTEVHDLNTILTADGIPVHLTDKTFLCKLCRYYSTLRLKHKDPSILSGNHKMFFESYKKRILHYNDIEVMDSEEAAEPIEMPPKAKRRRTKVDPKGDIECNDESEKVKSKSSSAETSAGLLPTGRTSQSSSSTGGDSMEAPATNDRSGASTPVIDYTSLDTPPCHSFTQEVKQSTSLEPNKLSNLHYRFSGEVQERDQVQNTDLVSRSYYPGQELLPLHTSFEFHERRPEENPPRPGEWEKCTAHIQYDKETKKLFHHLQRPYGNHSSFFRHLILLEKYWRSGDLAFSPTASSRSVNYLSSVHNRISSFEGHSVPLSSPFSAPSPIPVSSTPLMYSNPPSTSVPVIDLPLRRRLGGGVLTPSISTTPLVMSTRTIPFSAISGTCTTTSNVSVTPIFSPLPVSLPTTSAVNVLKSRRIPNILQVTAGGKSFNIVPSIAQIKQLQALQRQQMLEKQKKEQQLRSSLETNFIPLISDVRSLASEKSGGIWEQKPNITTKSKTQPQLNRPKLSVTILPKPSTPKLGMPPLRPGLKPSTVVTPTGIILSKSPEISVSAIPLDKSNLPNS